MKEEFTLKEIEAIVKFRQCLTDLKLDEDKNSDNYLIRWLRARDTNIEKAEIMLRKSLKWREENQIDQILGWKPPEICSQLFPMEICGHDKNGCPIVIFPLRYFDIKRFWSLEKEESQKFIIQNLEKILAAAKVNSTKENRVTEYVAIYDLDGFDFSVFMNKQHLHFLQETSTWIEEYYPGPFIRKSYCLYSPKLFSILFAMVKRILPKKIVERCEVHGMNREKWGAKLLEQIPTDQLPTKYGGTNTEFEKHAVHAFANSRVSAPGTVGQGAENCEGHGDGFIKACISPRKKLQIHYDVEEQHSSLSWIFNTDSCDIGFSILHANEEIVSYQRVPASEGAKQERNSVICEKIGRYTVLFDNSYSMLRPKTVYYKIEISNNTTSLSTPPDLIL